MGDGVNHREERPQMSARKWQRGAETGQLMRGRGACLSPPRSGTSGAWPELSCGPRSLYHGNRRMRSTQRPFSLRSLKTEELTSGKRCSLPGGMRKRFTDMVIGEGPQGIHKSEGRENRYSPLKEENPQTGAGRTDRVMFRRW